LEITDLIIDELCTGSREQYLQALIPCCTAARAFVDPCQKHIFRSVTLSSPAQNKPWSRREVVERIEKLFIKTLHFVDIINRRPHLRSNVQDLTYAVDSELYEHELDLLPEVGEAICQLTKLTSLTLCAHGPRPVPFAPREELITCSLSMLKHLPIKSFTLGSVKDFHLNLLTVPTVLEELTLANSTLDWESAMRQRR
jgi:hypothetical protein